MSNRDALSMTSILLDGIEIDVAESRKLIQSQNSTRYHMIEALNLIENENVYLKVNNSNN
jgi:hypothetical protein